MDTTTVALIASCCVLLVFIIGASLVLSYKCFRHLEARKLQRLSRSHELDVAIWAMSATNDLSVYGAGGDHSQYFADYRPKIYGAPEEYYIPGESHRENSRKKREHKNKHRDGRHQNHMTSSTQRGNSVSVINVRGENQGREEAEIVSSNHVISGHIYTRPREMNGDVNVHGNGIRRISEDSSQETRFQRKDNTVQGFIVTNKAGTAGGRGLVSPTMLHHHERDADAGHRGEIVDGEVLRPQLVRGHVIKQNVEVGEDGQFVVSGFRQRDIYDQNIPETTVPSGEPQTAYGRFSTHGNGQDDQSLNVTKSKKYEPHSSAFDQKSIPTDHRHNSTAMALESIAAAGVSVSVPQIIVTETLDHADSRSVTGSDVSEDNLGVKQKKDSVSEFVNYKDNYKVIKKHSVHKIPDWVIKTIAEKGSDADSDTEGRETLFQLEHRLSTSQEPSDHPNMEKRSISTSIHAGAEVRSRRQGVTFGSITHIQDPEIIEDEGASFEGDEKKLGERISEGDVFSEAKAYSTGGGGYMIADFIKPAGVETNTTEEVRVNPDGSTSTVTTTTTAVRQVRHIVEVGESVPSEISAHRSSFSEFSRNNLDSNIENLTSVEPPADYHM